MSAIKRSSAEAEIIETKEEKKSKKLDIDFLRENHTCAVCKEILIDPVTIYCGHNFCLDCCNAQNESLRLRHCPQCRSEFNARIHKVNIPLRFTLENIGGSEYQKIINERLLEKRKEKLKKYFKDSKLRKSIDNEIKKMFRETEHLYVDYDFLMEKLEGIFGEKYFYSILTILNDDYVCMKKKIIIRRNAEDYVNENTIDRDELMFLSAQVCNESFWTKKFNQSLNLNEYKLVEGEIKKINQKRKEEEILDEIEELINLHQPKKQ
tara:strand:- start:544 stop:1338 length:795 start_codon:yes stop_codon:yes gene_type:complete